MEKRYVRYISSAATQGTAIIACESSNISPAAESLETCPKNCRTRARHLYLGKTRQAWCMGTVDAPTQRGFDEPSQPVSQIPRLSFLQLVPSPHATSLYETNEKTTQAIPFP
ncbi:hypothetical protein BDP55DRAFT_625712 [Colletotrichum godetiae]|uniref:Uncharacterized protein n=1 Tax=Colletotrichum godetiae TaxID=1209918 RepID=A0AAJ0B2Y9_9PEZI|nr:uncharacterized protein BDP55DRAFT_625712 [Colletotrichum godetiae]KAK1701500.1 hypothetical protein BDP55DRAFT_625712 [Colletotrichum godetiae]